MLEVQANTRLLVIASDWGARAKPSTRLGGVEGLATPSGESQSSGPRVDKRS